MVIFGKIRTFNFLNNTHFSITTPFSCFTLFPHPHFSNSMKRTLLLSLFLLLTVVGRSWGQSRPVSGRIIDKSTNEGLPGVSVIVKGTTTGTATDADGRYALNIAGPTATLQFKYLGYVTAEQAVGSSATLDVAMAVDNKELNEVVVTALGISREKRALGFAVSEVKAEQVVQKSEPDILRTLTGKIPGVNILSSSGLPGSSSRITIRGNTSLLGSNEPLFIVDGVPYDNTQTDSENSLVRGAGYSSRTADIDPNNIASINVLKGAAAAALYGSRAAGGVIVITTKTGGGGQRGPKGVQIGYTTGYSIEKIAALPDYQNDYGAGANFVQTTANGSWGPKFGSFLAPATIPHPQAYDPVTSPNFPDIPAGTRIPYQAYPNNVQDYFKTGHVFENSVSLSGSGDNTTFTAVLSRADQQGIIPYSSFVRNNVSAGGSGHFNKFTVNGNVAYTNSQQHGPQLGANNAVGNASAFSRILFLTRSLDLQGLPYIDPITKFPQFAWLTAQADNPIWSAENNSYVSRVDRVVGSVGLAYAIKDWLTVTYTGGVNTYTDFRRTTVRPGSVGYNRLGNVLEDSFQNTELEQTLLVNVNKNLTEDISLTASVGQNVNQRKFEGLSYTGGPIIVFGIDNIQNTEQKNTNGYAYTKRRLMGLLANVTVGYKNWAFLTATGRNDWSSTLNKNGVFGQSGRSFFYSSVSSSVVLNEALGFNAPWLDLLKVRAAYGRVGRDASPYQSGAPLYNINPSYGNNSGTSAFPFTGVAGLALSNSINNPALTPEFTNELEVGTEMTLFRNRISVNATYYDKRTTNQILPQFIASSTGYNVRVTNFGEVSNKGVELALNIVPLDTKGFRWSSTFNFTHNKNIVESLGEGNTKVAQIPFGSGFTGGAFAVHIAGQPYGVIFGSSAARDENGKYLIDPATGRLIRGVSKVIGNPNPQFIMGFINQFTYKNFTLNTLVDYRKGGDLYSTTLQQELGRGVTKDTEDRNRLVVINGVQGNPLTGTPLLQKDAAGNPIPNSALPNSTAISVNDLYFGAGSAAIGAFDEQSIYDATTVRLRELTLGYDLPKSVLAKTPFGIVNISVSGRNLYWYSPNIPKHSNFDPETSTFGASNQQGFEYTNAPTTRRYGVNLRVTF